MKALLSSCLIVLSSLAAVASGAAEKDGWIVFSPSQAPDTLTGTITGYTVYHHITDHLGSVRTITDAGTGTVVETSDYLPFGTRWSRTGGSLTATLTDPTNRWHYSGKEEQAAISTGIQLVDYGARMYDPVIARWMAVDPMAEEYYPMTPYGYCAGNPIVLVDPFGEDWYTTTGPNGELSRLFRRVPGLFRRTQRTFLQVCGCDLPLQQGRIREAVRL